MSHAISLGTALFLTSARAQTRDDVVQENDLLSVVRAAVEGNDIVFPVIRSNEAQALASAGAAASRQGDRLRLRMRSGAAKVYRDSPECRNPLQEAECVTYWLVAHALSRGIFVLAQMFYEALAFVLVNDASGAQTNLNGFPYFSPSGQRALVLVQSAMTGDLEIQVWRRQGPRFTKEWDGSPYVASEGWLTYKFLRWTGDAQIDLQADVQGLTPTVRRFSLARENGDWTAQD